MPPNGPGQHHEKSLPSCPTHLNLQCPRPCSFYKASLQQTELALCHTYRHMRESPYLVCTILVEVRDCLFFKMLILKSYLVVDTMTFTVHLSFAVIRGLKVVPVKLVVCVGINVGMCCDPCPQLCCDLVEMLCKNT